MRHNAMFGGIARLKNRIHPVENSVVQSRLPRRRILQRSGQVSVAWKEGIQDSSSTANSDVHANLDGSRTAFKILPQQRTRNLY